MALIPLNTFKTKTATLITGTYDQSKCARDTALIIDSIAFDLLFGGKSQSNFAGLQYWAQGATKIPQEKLQTLAAMDYAKDVARQIVAGTFPGQIPGTAGSLAAQQKIATEFDLISSIIEKGTAGTTDKIIPNSQEVTDPGFVNAVNLLIANKAIFQQAVIDYINSTFGPYTYNKSKCLRDTKLIVDSLAFDLLFDSSSQSEFAGLQYWGQGLTQIPFEVDQTLAAINYAKTVAKKIVRNELSTPATGNNFYQIIDPDNPGNLASVTNIENNFSVVTDIITNGVSTISDDIVPNGLKTDVQGLLNAYELLQQNKKYIQHDVVAWVNDQILQADDSGSIWFGFIYDSEKCFRDVGFIIDCISFDLIYGGNRQSVQAGAYYYGFNAGDLNLPSNEQSVTISAFTYLKSIAYNVIRGEKVPVTYQYGKTQVVNGPGGSDSGAAYVSARVDLINNIIENGPNVVTSERIPIGLEQSLDQERINAFNQLIANKEFLAAEVVAYIDNITAETFDYDEDKCYRDLGFILDCVTFDLKYNGNRQAIQSGVYYFDKSADISIVPTEKTDTISAYNYLKTLLPSVIRGIEIPKNTLLQNNAVQITEYTPATQAEAELAQDKIDVILDIIENGPTAESAIIIDPSNINDPNHASRIISLDPVFESPSVEEDLTNAFNILLANRAFLTAEVIGYMDTNLNPAKNTRVYTSPPGVTAIILMAQVANVTDHDVKVSFAHYRNIPVLSDPSTENGYQAADTTTEIVKEFTVPPNDSVNLLNGRMIIESFDSIIAKSSENGALKLTLSILETATT